MTGYIYNGFGQYETKGKEKGITLKYAGQEFFLPYGKVTPIPDFHFREVDHAATAEAWEQGDDSALIYRTLRIPGERVVEELTDAQNVGGAEPVKNRDRGIIPIKPGPKNQLDKLVKTPAGASEEGKQLFEEVRVITAAPEEIEQAETLALEFKKLIVEAYLDSRAERASGGQGRLRATGMEKIFMDELGIEDFNSATARMRPAAAVTAAPASVAPEVMSEFLGLLRQAMGQGIPAAEAKALAENAAKKVAEKEKAFQ